MISSIQSAYGTCGFTTAGCAKTRLNQSFEEVLSLKKNRSDSFSSTLSLSEQAWFEEIRSGYHVNNMSWKQGQSLVSELVGRGVVSSSLNELGNAIVTMFPPDCTDENGNLTRVVSGWECVDLAFDEGYEGTFNYVETLRSSLEHQWQGYNTMVEKYGDIYPNEKAWLEEQGKLFGILQQMGNT